MSTWRSAFETSAEQVPDRDELVLGYKFGGPASEADIAALEQHYGATVPDQLRAMLTEFNGIAIKERYWGDEWLPLYLSTDQVLTEVQDYIRTSGNPMPPDAHMANVIFFAHQNGFAELYGICVRSFDGFAVGQILALDHETGEFDFEQDSLSHFVRNHEYCRL